MRPTASLRFGIPDYEVREPGFLTLLQHVVRLGPAHIGVDEDDSLSGLGQRHRQVRRHHVLPSPGPVLVTTRLRDPSCADENSTFVRTPLNASAKFAGHPVVDQRNEGLAGFSRIFGTRPRQGMPEVHLISSGDLIRLSRRSKKNRHADGKGAGTKNRE